MMTRISSVVLVLALAGCGEGTGGLFGNDEPEQVVAAVDAPQGDLAAGAPQAPAGDGQFVGYSVASLGDATRPGLWLETPLVTAQGPGRVVARNGTVVAVTLIPSGGERGSGSRISLAAMQALEVPLTDLPTLTVISDG